ncbi:phage terminase small subunit P27 family [Dellaglioa algida]|uniref:phage terminase small subunit P27 family n=1 Tax=Dellaglioa algida TaxID=105612 RepID=UPI0024DE1D7B|nr:phage terminase small subunit P27 family [Dellaglioa algida]MDK1740084.1 phage terminase small subunit P27 family [Dellaglioa algida]
MALGRPVKLTGYDGDLTKQVKANKKQAQTVLFNYKKLSSNPPDYLKGEALKEWKRVVPLLKKDTPISELDRMVIINYCQTAGIIVDCQKYINENGMFEDDGRKNNYLLTQQQAMRDCKSYATTLGMTLESRSKLEYGKAKNTTPDDPFKELLSS